MSILVAFGFMIISIVVGILSIVAIINEIITRGNSIRLWIILEVLSIIAFVYSIYEITMNIINLLKESFN